MVDGHKAYLVETITGQVGAELQISKDSWSIPLNGVEDGSVTVNRASLDSIDRARIQPGFGSILITNVTSDFYGRIVEEVPIIAGPIRSFPSITKDEVQIKFRGIRSIFEKRYVIREEPANARTDVKFVGLSLGSIAQGIVKVCTDKTGGSLPIVFGTPYEELGGTTHTRTYEWWNVANNAGHDALDKLSSNDNGPDIMFRPEWKDDDQQYIQWVMYNGTETQPKIAQKRVADFDLTSEDSGIVDYSIVSDGSHMVSRCWGTGAGEGSGTVVTFSQDLTTVQDGHPLYESLISDSEVTKDKIGQLKSQTDSAVRNNQSMIDQLSLVIDPNHPKNPFGSWHVGDDISVTLNDEIVIPEGTYLMRVISASGSESGDITLELQEVRL